MSKAPTPDGDAAPRKKGGKKKLVLLAVPVVLLAAGAGLWFSGILPGLLGMGPKPAPMQAADQPAMAPKPPVFVDLPEMVANLNVGARRTAFIKLHARIEISRAEDQPVVAAAMPRLQDMFQTYLRETRPEELRGSAGTWRLREELVARANIAASPAHVTDVLFTEMLVQ